MYIEDEAKQKICAVFSTDGIRYCRGASCMQWRWVNRLALGVVVPAHGPKWMSTGGDELYAVESTRPPHITDEWLWDRKCGVWIVDGEFVDRGYCGLAGKPG